MLGKLLKYEIMATGRVMLPLYAVLLAASAMLGLSVRMDQAGNSGLLTLIVVFLFIIAVVAVVVISVLLILQRFHKNLLGTEGYLMFTLPVRTDQNIASKAVTALLWIVGGMLTGGLSGCLFIWITNGWKAFSTQIGYLWDLLISESSMGPVIFDILLILAIILLSLLETVMKVYAAMAVGHQWSSHRVLGSILAYVGFGVVEVVLVRILNLPGFMGSFAGEEVAVIQGTSIYAQIGIDRAALLPVLGVIVAGILIYGAITWYLLDRRLNLE